MTSTVLKVKFVIQSPGHVYVLNQYLKRRLPYNHKTSNVEELNISFRLQLFQLLGELPQDRNSHLVGSGSGSATSLPLCSYHLLPRHAKLH